MDEVRSNNNVAYRCNYHVVWCPKYRRKVITRTADDRLKQIIRDVRAEPAAPLVELQTTPDHVHRLVVRDPQYGIHRLVTQVKGRSSRLGGRNSRTSAGACRPCGPTATSPPLPAVRPWRQSNAMSRTSATSKQLHPYLPMAEARGFAGGSR